MALLSRSLLPITEDEVRGAKTGWSHSASGLDKVSVATAKTLSDLVLSTFFNVLLFRSVQRLLRDSPTSAEVTMFGSLLLWKTKTKQSES
jgi:hypothetical protein